MRIVFFGSDDFAGTCLKEILKSSHEIVACVTQPDTRQGRGMKLSLSPIKQIAFDDDLLCLQPDSLKESSVIEALRFLQADLFVVVAYGKILSETILNIPKLFCVNVHGSLLPKYRGAAPVNWAIINGENETGVTIMKMNAKMDAGDIISQEVMPLSNEITSDVLREQMAQVGAKLLVTTLDQIAQGSYACTAQDEAQVTVAHKLTKEMGRIDWNQPAIDIERRIRGLKPWPGTYCMYKGKILKILQASVVQGAGSSGDILEISKNGITVACSHDALLIKEVHLEASKPALAHSFLQGHPLKIGQKFA